ncbi:hypothetical protein F4780DRAFT_87106 [Xylariomycetidae sp. FL0641]|nr:hypothetical protein F4780DRAFT_87106 [Xylariomycetidae sp. FL0641]
MKGRPIDQLVHEAMFPNKLRSSDPQNFQALLHRHLVLEVRQEVHSFYGHLDTHEAKYPGLDYCNRIHRIRLSRWPWHRRLFRTFDALRLTEAEISSLTKWEGTKWAKERYERDSGVTIRDTAGDGIADFVEPEDRPQGTRTAAQTQPEEAEDSADEDMVGEEDSDGELESVGFALNERLRERAARHEAGETPEPLDEEWEQWLKNAIDSGEFPFLTGQDAPQAPETNLVPQSFFPPRMVSAARAGQWEEIPESLRDHLRRALASEAVSRNLEAPTHPASRENPYRSYENILNRLGHLRRTYADLRLPVGETGSNGTSEVRVPRTAQPHA